MNNWWDNHIQRCRTLDEQSNGTCALIKFYEQLVRGQQKTYDYLRSNSGWSPSGDIAVDFRIIRDGSLPLLKAVQTHGPQPLVDEAKSLLESNLEGLGELVERYWSAPSDLQFFGKACLQPYLKLLSDSGVRPVGREFPHSDRRCAFCGGNPQLSVFQNNETDSGSRDLICASCLTSWEFRRVVCANCGEEQPTKLGYFHSAEFAHVRIEACDSCMHYLKGIDLTRLGLAVPLVDEIYAAPLDLWARDHGYTKIELNIVGI